MRKILRNAPSVKRLIATFKIDQDTALEIRSIIQYRNNPISALKQIDSEQLINSYGVVDLVINPSALPNEWQDNVPFSYINTGDTYSATLVAKDNRIFISCWGDEYERLPKRLTDRE